MKKEVMRTGILVELDSLYDTRLATLSKIDLKIATELLCDPKTYLHRIKDEFEGIDSDTFKDLYLRRDKDTLKRSPPTLMFEVLKNFIGDVLEANGDCPFIAVPSIYVNTYPYQLTDEEIEPIFNAVKAITADLADVEFIYKSYKELDYQYLKDRIHYLALYEFFVWLDYHQTRFNENNEFIGNLGLTLMAPKLSFTGTAQSKKDLEDAIEIWKEIYLPVVNLVFLPIAMYSTKYTFRPHIEKESTDE